tara:strand:+ start:51 stop:317 length:267 start_codon:yes stop_codon:yes gene_type:complete
MRNEISRKIIIDKYQGNTHYTVHVIDSFGQEHHMGYYLHLDEEDNIELENRAEEIWSNEVKREITPIERAIKNCIDIDISNGREPSLD